MKRPVYILAITLLFAAAAPAQEEIFDKAQAAYDDGRYAEAVLLYDNLLSEGVSNMELHYNLANAAFKDSDLPKAVFHYRKAWYMAPRDPDINANLHFALNAAGSVEPSQNVLGRVLSSMTKGEWIGVAVVGYVLLAVLLSLMLLLKLGRKTLVKLCVIPLFLLALAFSGWRYWKALETHPEWVVEKNDATALFGPVEGSTAHYKLPLAALVRQTDMNAQGWIEVEYDGKRGWLESDQLRPVSP